MSENENNFETLRRLLALKRREGPPPGYFDDFSSRVTSRIRAGDGASESLIQRLSRRIQFYMAFEIKPVYSGAFAMALCLLLFVGIVYMQQRSGTAMQPVREATVNPNPAPEVVALAAPATPVLLQPLAAMANTNPAIGLPANATVLNLPPRAFIHQVGFSLPAN